MIFATTYESAAVLPDGRARPVVANPVTEYVPTAHPGCRAPHIWLECAGQRLSTLDLFGRSFVLLAGRAGTAWCQAALLNELARITAAIPQDELAIQWDTAVEFAILEGVTPTFLADSKADILERLIRLGNRIPVLAELGYHLCYGDAGHKHFKEPEDTGKLVEVANALSAGLRRPIKWIHLPVPRNRLDAAYYGLLRHLRLHPETELYLGVVHVSDGVEGTW